MILESWGVNTPEEYGGMDLGAVMSAIVAMECGRSFVPFAFGGYADNILYAANEEQKQRYLIPTLEGERISCFAITEPGAGSDAATSGPPPGKTAATTSSTVRRPSSPGATTRTS